MEQWNDFLNEFVKVIFEDGENHYSKKEGIFKGFDETHIFLLINNKTESINRLKILRVEEIREVEK